MAQRGVVLLDPEQQSTLSQRDRAYPAANNGRMASPRTNFTSSRTNTNANARTNANAYSNSSTASTTSRGSHTDRWRPAGGVTLYSANALDAQQSEFSQHGPHGGTNDSPPLATGEHAPYPMLRDLSGDIASMDATDRDDGFSLQRPPRDRDEHYPGTGIGYMLLALVLGIGLGVLLSELNESALVAQWVGLPGELYARAVQCLALPYVFCAMATAIGDLVSSKKAYSTGMCSLRVLVFFWVAATVTGMCVALSFRSSFTLPLDANQRSQQMSGLTCSDGNVVSSLVNGSLACQPRQGLNVDSSTAARQEFAVVDIKKSFRRGPNAVLDQYDVGHLIAIQFHDVVSPNVMATVAKGDLLAVLGFAVVLGVVARHGYQAQTRQVNYLYPLLLQLRDTFFVALQWVTMITPVAVVSEVAATIMTHRERLLNIPTYPATMYFAAILVAVVLECLIVVPLLTFLLTRKNPFRHLATLARAIVFAFSSGSPLATVPVALACLQETKLCSRSLSSFVIMLGEGCNSLDSGLLMPITFVFLAESSGTGGEMQLGQLAAIFVLGLLSCIASPVSVNSNGAMAYVAIMGHTLPHDNVPALLPLVVAVGNLLRRVSGVCNITSTVLVLHVVAEKTHEAPQSQSTGTMSE